MTKSIDWKERFDGAYGSMSMSIQERVWREVYGEDFPEGVGSFSYLSGPELQAAQRQLDVGRGDVLGDLGCGRGGPGLWIAAHTGADLIGVDISSVALEQARQSAGRVGLSGRAEFRAGSFERNDLAEGCLDAVMSIDALMFASDRSLAISQIARVLRPGGRFVATTIDYSSQPDGQPPQVDDHRPILADAGFEITRYETTDHWRDRMESVASKLLAASAEIAAETGQDPARMHSEASRLFRQTRETVECMRRRVFLTAVLMTA